MHETDVAIIGGGIVGCSTLFELERRGYNCTLLEKNENLMSEASGGNSGMLHCGFDAPQNSLELHCIRRCQDKVFHIFDKLGIPYLQNGSIMVAWNPDEAANLNIVHSSSLAKGVREIFPLSLKELYQQEPFLNKQAVQALWIPNETIVEPAVYGLLLAHHARYNGAKILTRCNVQGYTLSNENHGLATLETTHGPINAKVIINCAGLHGDKVQQLAGLDTFMIKPRKGQYVVFGQEASHFIKSSILPVPTEKTKGIIVFKTVHGNVIVGPTAEDVDSRSRAPVDPILAQRLLDYGCHTVPELTSCSAVGHYTGVRPATQYKDYQIQSFVDRHWITVGGIRSTGVSASLGIAELVVDMVQGDLKLDPSRGMTSKLHSPTWSLQPDGTLCADGHSYTVTHPITKFGLQHSGLGSKL